MTLRRLVAGLAAMTSCLPGAAAAQAPAGGLLSGLGGAASGLLGGGGGAGLGSIGIGNAAGVLSYCVRNRLLGTAATPTAPAATVPKSATPAPGTAAAVLGALTGRQGVAASPGFAAGQGGQLLAGTTPALSLDDLGTRAKARVCDMVLKRARTLL